MKNKTQRLACIDIGSNAIKYRQYRISKQKSKNFAELDTCLLYTSDAADEP